MMRCGWCLVILVVVVLAWCGWGGGVEAFHFPIGYSHGYSYTAINSLMNHKNVTTVLKFHIETVGEDEANGTRTHVLKIDSYAQEMEEVPVMENPGKWDLSKPFVFVSGPRGAIVKVHSHPADKSELLVVKRALASLFSVDLQMEDVKDEWSYETEESDHLGDLSHRYSVQRTNTGFTLRRQHFSVTNAHRLHNKTLSYDHRGTLLSGEVRDHVVVKDQSATVNRSKPFPSEEPHVTSTSGAQPDFEAFAIVTVKYTGKRRTLRPSTETVEKMLDTLRTDSLHTKHEPVSTRLEKTQYSINKAWDCIHQFPLVDSENRSACVNQLRDHLRDLDPRDYRSYVDQRLAKVCNVTDDVCVDDRLVLIDVVTRLGDVTSQELIVTYVLSKRPWDDEELRRVFIHCAAMKQPTEAFVNATENVCFGEQGGNLGVRTLSSTQRRACLAVGSLIKHLESSGQQEQAHRLADRLETWLDSHALGDAPVVKRDASKDEYQEWMSEHEESQHLSKAVLLHALGNGALERSKGRLLSHAAPNNGHHIWRRAALDALRHYNCSETARAAFSSVTQDDVFSVRRMALAVFAKHPRRNDVTAEEENNILSDNYTYPAVARVKRSVFDKVLFQFKVALPPYEWSREVGSSKIGGSFGIKFQNSVEGMFRILDGYVDVDVHDKAWIEIHVGYININIDILRVEACYRGRLSYNMNIVKDFTVGLMADINSAFEHIINRVTEPMLKFAERLALQYQDSATGVPKSGFEPLADAVKNLPNQTQDALKAAQEFNEEADLLGALPLIKKLQDVTSRAQTLMEDVNAEVADVFSKIGDVSQIGLPFAEKEVRSAVNSVLGVLKKVTDFPNQALNFIERGKMRYQLAMMRILEGRKIVNQVFSALSGGKMSWGSAAQEVNSIISQTKALIAKVKADFARRRRQTSTSTANYTLCAQVDMDDALIRLYNKSEGMVSQLEIVLTKPKELQQALDLMNTQVEILKAGFASFKEALDMVKSRIHALMGVKFHPEFPGIRRDCDDQCGCGSYPTDCKRYGHPGMDLILNRGWKVVSPISGMAYKVGNSSVKIKPKTDDLKEYDIYISNIKVHSNYTNQTEFFVEAGQWFAESLGNNGCSKGHIHLAMRRTSNTTQGLCHYVDPSAFIPSSQPVPVWVQECKEFTFKHIGQVVDFANMSKGFKDILTKLKREALEGLKTLAIDKVKDLIPNDSLLAPFKDLSLAFLNGLDTNASSLKNLFTPGWNAAKEFFGNLKKGNTLSFKGLLDMAANSNLLKTKLPDLHRIASLGQKLVKLPETLEKLKNRTVGALSRLGSALKGANFSLSGLKLGGLGLSWPSFGNGSFSLGKLSLSLPSIFNFGSGNSNSSSSFSLKDKISDFFHDLGDAFNSTRIKEVLAGGKDKLLAQLKKAIREKLCPELGKLLAKHGSPCIPNDNCTGILCDVQIRRTHLTGRLQVNVTVDRAAKTLYLNVDGQDHTVSGDADSTVPTGLKLFNAFDVKFRVNSTWHGDDLHLSLTLQACGPNLCCLPDVELARNLSFSDFAVPDLGSLFNGSNIELLPLDSSYKVYTDLNVDSPELTQSILGIKDLIRDNFNITLPEDTQYRVEFKDPEDFHDDGQFPLSGQRMEVYVPLFPPLRWPFPIGPVVVWIRFSGGVSFGLNLKIHVQSVDTYLKATMTPWASAKLEAGVSVDIFVFAFGADLYGWIMKTEFPLSIETNYTKQPLVTTKTLDLNLIPLEVKLVLWVEIKLQIKIWGVKITLFHKRWSWTVWHWTSSGFGGTLWRKESRKDDLGPPRFPYCSQVDNQCSSGAAGRRRRSVSGPSVCQVQQLVGRHFKDVAFSLDFTVGDDDSDLKLSYAVGDYAGGTNVRGWTALQGSLLTIAEDSGRGGGGGGILGSLPCGKALHFLVKAVNSQGLSTSASCSLPTLDCTLPDGRVDAVSRCTSHRSKLVADIIVYEDSELDTSQLSNAVGFGPGLHGNQVSDWETLTLDSTSARPGVAGSLRYFSSQRHGRLSAKPLRAVKSASEATCADECLKNVLCVSFSFNALLFDCELQGVTEGLSAKRLPDNHFYSYERLDQGYSAHVERHNLDLRHGVRYYVNGMVGNVLGYESELYSEGIMVDHTPPEPGPLGEGAVDSIVRQSGCNASVIQRCQDLVPDLDHRHIIDGKGASTVFNGNRRGEDLDFTFENHFASANWDGFHDGEAGIFGYTWAVGTSVCGEEVSNFTDPHLTSPDQRDWTHLGFRKGLHLAEGAYYVTVQAVSDILHGGDLVTTLCHSTPYLIDITPPVMHSVSDVIFDDGFRFLAVYFNASDDLSGVERAEFGLGLTKYDVMVRRYMPFEMRGGGENTYLLNEEFETASGVPAWIRIKVVDRVGLSATGHGGTPVLIDSTPPVPGELLDGLKMGVDSCCQGNHTTICAQWRGFEDPESHIDSYWWGVGTSAGKDDVVPFQKLSSYVRHSCQNNVNLLHNHTYVSTIVAQNKALNQKAVNVSSNGVLVDVTPPVAGIVVDGDDVTEDLDFTSETASVASEWRGFHDPETGVSSYSVSVLVNGVSIRHVTEMTSESFTDHSFSLVHGDEIKVEVTAINGADSTTSVTSDGLRVDHTPPELVFLGTEAGTRYQQEQTTLNFTWSFQDPESGLAEYRCVVHQQLYRSKTQLWPPTSSAGKDQHVISVNVTSPNTTRALQLSGLSLVNGASYTLTVTALNWAHMTSVEQSTPVTIDSTPPVVDRVLIALPDDEEEVNELGQVEHVEGELLHVSWLARDFESDVTHVHLCVGIKGTDCLASNDVIVLEVASLLAPTTVLNDTGLNTSVEYEVRVKVVNGAGVTSSVVTSKPIVILEGNVAGVVNDGREGEDLEFTNDKASVAITFSGFSSKACGIETYEWGVGTTPYATDILPFTPTGLVVEENDEGAGRAQAHLTLSEGLKYYVAVRALTGHNCHQPVIVSCSDGITVDTRPPDVTFFRADAVFSGVASASSPSVADVTSLGWQEAVYQTSRDQLELGWAATDPSGVNRTVLTLDMWGQGSRSARDVTSSSFSSLTLASPLTPGDALSPVMWTADNAGNEVLRFAPWLMVDTTPPSIQALTCNNAVSEVSPLVTCTWTSLSDPHSRLADLELGVGSGFTEADLFNMTSVPVHAQRWTFDALHFHTAIFGLGPSIRVDHFYVIAGATNAAGLTSYSTARVVVDVTTPEVTSVVVVTSARPSRGSLPRVVCQTSGSYVEVDVQGLKDDESGITSVELALGSTPGISDLYPFARVTLNNGVYAKGGLALKTGSTVYPTVRITNGVGLYSIVKGEGVVISPQPRLEVIDGPGPTDMDGQANFNTIQGHWRLTDNCPVVSGEWWVSELGSSRAVRTKTPLLPNNSNSTLTSQGNDNVLRHFYDDTLWVYNLMTYIVHVRVTDAANRTLYARSDGVTVVLGTPDTARVWEGAGPYDMDFQAPLTSIQASWEPFGDPRSVLPSQRVLRYEVAVGTDRGSSQTRSNVHGFQDVGQVTSYTFRGLNLTAKTVTYYVTVRAHSGAGTFSESSSDGVRAGYSGEIDVGRVLVDSHQSEVSVMRVSWEGFRSDMGDMRFFLGLSTALPPWDNATHDCQTIQNTTFTYDAYPLSLLPADQSVVTLQNLTLTHNATYYVTIMAEDLMLHCAAAVGGPVLVDTTPPQAGNVTAQGHDAGYAIYLHSSSTLVVDLGGFPDDESGVESVSVDLYSSSSKCGTPGAGDILIQSLLVLNETQVTMRDLTLAASSAYYLKTTVTNRARLSTEATSRPLLLVLDPPSPGAVKLTANWTQGEILFQGRNDSVRALVAVASVDSSPVCFTQVDSLAKQDAWRSVTSDGFSADCSFVERSEVTVLLQHDAHLTGVDRGAAQRTQLTWAEGNYTVRMQAASGEHALTGLALTTASLLPPFLTQNALLFPSYTSNVSNCDPFSAGCSSSNSTNGQALPVDGQHGCGISLAEVNGTTSALFWAQDSVKLRQTMLSLDFDPVSSAAEYTFGLKEMAEGGGWEVQLYVQGARLAAFSGLVFATDPVLTVYTWNVDGYFPPVTDPLQPFRTLLRVTEVKTPLTPRPSCSYGAPFHDGSTGVKEVWAGVSSSDNSTADVWPFQLVSSFCPPCLRGCSNLCPAGCPDNTLTTAFRLVPVLLNNLNLQAANEALNASANNSLTGLATLGMPMYYVDVKVVSHGGLLTVAKSSALTVDTSPPDVTEIYCIDPTYDPDQPVKFVGSNTTVGLKWTSSDDVSPITSQRVCVGTQSGFDDVVPWVKTDSLASSHVFNALSPALVEGGQYFTSLSVTNAAGLVALASSPFTVMTSPPNMTIMSPGLGAVTNNVILSGVDVALTNSTDTVEVNLNFQAPVDGANTLDTIEWSVGTGPGKDDLFPNSVVANSNVSKVALVGGFVHMEGENTGITIKDYVNNNVSASDSTSAKSTRKKRASGASGSGDPSTMFRLEPGICLHQTVTGLSKSHVASTPLQLGLLCVQRERDSLVQPGNSTITVNTRTSTSTSTPSSSATTPTRDVQLQLHLLQGGLVVGSLNSEDLNAMYGSAASTTFSPYIVLPDPTDPVSRLLARRLQDTPGPSFFLSPVADVRLGDDVTVTYYVNSTVNVPAGFVAVLMYWDTDAQRWRMPGERCASSKQLYNNQTRLVDTKICLDVFIAASSQPTQRVKRSTGTPALTPRMFTLAVVGASPANTAPTVHRTSLTLQEDDGPADVTLTYTDAESDVVTFSLLRAPRHGVAYVTSDGLVTYEPDVNFAGSDVIVVQGVEVLDAAFLQAGLVPYAVNVTIDVIVYDVNDPPDIFALPDWSSNASEHVLIEHAKGSAAGNGINITVLIEGNTTTFLPLLLYGFGDVDANNNVTHLGRAFNDVNATLRTTDVSLQDPRVTADLNMATLNSGLGVKAVTLDLGEGYSGFVHYEARMHDSAGAYSRQLTVGVHVMISPCIHGDCRAVLAGLSCLDPQRAFTFDPYWCQCHPGYQGTWCEMEIDECLKATCSPVTDCEDLVNGYRCVANPEKTAAIVLCSLFAIALLLFVVYKIKKRDSKVDLLDENSILKPLQRGDSLEVATPPLHHARPIQQRDFGLRSSVDHRYGSSMAGSSSWDSDRPGTAMTTADLLLEEDAFTIPRPSPPGNWASSILDMFPYRPLGNPTKRMWRPMSSTGHSDNGSESRQSTGRTVDGGGEMMTSFALSDSGQRSNTRDAKRAKGPLRPVSSERGGSSGAVSGFPRPEPFPDYDRVPVLPMPDYDHLLSIPFPDYDQRQAVPLTDLTNGRGGHANPAFSSQGEMLPGYGETPFADRYHQAQVHVRENVISRYDDAGQHGSRMRVEAGEGEAVTVEGMRGVGGGRSASAVRHMSGVGGGGEHLPYIGE